MASYRHTLAPPHINNDFYFTQVHGISVNAGANDDVIIPGGALDVSAVILASAEPTVSIMTHDLTTALTEVGLSTGLSCTGASTFYYQRRADAGTFTTSTTHQKLVSATGFLNLNSISVAQDSAAELALTYYPFSSDGVTQPLAYTDSVALGSSPAFVSKFFFGGVKLGSSFLNGVTSVSYDNGLAFRYHAQDGAHYRTNGSIYARTPSITLTWHSVQALANYSPDLFIDAATNLKVFFKKGVSGSHRVANATAEHTSILFATSAWKPVSIDAQGSEDTALSIRATCIGTPTLDMATAIS